MHANATPVEVPAGTSYGIAMRALIVAVMLLVNFARPSLFPGPASADQPVPPVEHIVPYTQDPPCRYFQDCQQET